MPLVERVKSLIWGIWSEDGAEFSVQSPLDEGLVASGQLFEDFHLLGRRELPPLLAIDRLCLELAALLEPNREQFTQLLSRETGFSLQDSAEMVVGSFDYVRRYSNHSSTQLEPAAPEGFESNGRHLSLQRVPVGTIVVILPHNAFLPLALSCMLNALRAGNRVILRAPTQSAGSAFLFSQAIAEIPELAPWVSVIVCSAAPFVDWFFGSKLSGTLHFFGSSRRASELIARGFDSGKNVLVDGEGNTWVYVDSSFEPAHAAKVLVEGAYRYNGQTCTSINGAIVHPDIFDQVESAVRQLVGKSDVGPVFNERQASWCIERIGQSGGECAIGGTASGSVVSPTLVLDPDMTSELVREGIFGPVLWLTRGDAERFRSIWPENGFPLCAGILQDPVDWEKWSIQLGGAARLVFNGDPSVEDAFEFWGGYPPAGQNAVSAWPEKYQRTVQIDLPSSSVPL